MYRKFLSLFILFVSCLSFGQKFTSSPYSSFGIGEYPYNNHPTYAAFGGASVGMADSLNINFDNPSGYGFLSYGQPLFSAGFSFQRSTFSEAGSSFKSNNANIGHFALAVPFAKRFGMAFGLKQFSRVGYDITENTALNASDTMIYKYFGEGSVNDAFVGFSLKVLTTKKHQLALGVNGSYLFGTLNHGKTARLAYNDEGAYESSSLRVKSLYYNLGLTYAFNINDENRFTLGGTFTPQQDVAASKEQNLYLLKNVNSFSSDMFYDTISSFYENKSLTLPQSYHVGLSYSFRPKTDSTYNKVRIPQFSVYASYNVQDWSTYKANFSNDSSQALMNTSRIAVGFEFSPHYNYLDRTKAVDYFSRIRYRVGFQTGTMPVYRGTDQFVNQSFSLGFGFPILSQRSTSSLNLSLSYGSKSNGQNAALKEDYFSVQFGIVLSPGQYDRWFRKYKID